MKNTGERITKDICQLSEKEMQSEIRGRKIAMVFQDPMTSLNPTMTIGNQIMEPMIHHYNTPKEEAYKKAVELLQLVGITNAEKTYEKLSSPIIWWDETKNHDCDGTFM